MSTISTTNNILINNLILKLPSNSYNFTDKYNHKLNQETNSIKDNKKTDRTVKNIDIFGDLTPIIKNKIKRKALLENKNKSKRKKYSSLSNFIDCKTTPKKKNYFNLNIITNSTTKENSQISLSSNKIKNKKKVNPEIFVNKRIDLQINYNNMTVKTIDLEPKKKLNITKILHRFEEEQKKTSKRLEEKKQKIREQEKKIHTGKPSINKIKFTNYEKYSKDFLIRQKELQDDLKLKKKKLIEEHNKKKEKEYQLIISNNILNKETKTPQRKKSSYDWVDRLYCKDMQKRKMERFYLENAFAYNFTPHIEKKNVKYVLNKNKRRINKVIKEYEEKTNPELLIDYLNKNNILEEHDTNLFRNKIFGKTIHKNKEKKINNSIE